MDDGGAAMKLVVFVSSRRGRLASIVSGDLAGAILSPRGTRRARRGILLPLRIHSADSYGRWS